MSRRVSITATLDISGDDVECEARAFVLAEAGRAYLDGSVEVLLDGSTEWIDLDDLDDVSRTSRERVEEGLCEAVFEGREEP